MTEASEKIVTPEALARIRADLKAQGRTVVQAHGCFDIVHPGHIRYLRFARDQGDVLVVSVSADDVVGKGADRPYINEDLRLENLAVLEFVDYVVLDHHAWAGPILETVRPDVYVKGKEYETGGDPRFLQEKDLVEGYGGRVIFGSGDVVFSSTAIIDRFREQFRLDAEKTRFFCRRHGVTRAAVDGALRAIGEARILVLGNPILDRHIHSEMATVAAEAPVLSVVPMHQDTYLGGGALIARQLANLGAKAGYLTVLGRDAEAEDFAEGLAAGGVTLHRLEAHHRPVFVKTRYLVDGNKVFKVDEGAYSPLAASDAAELVARLEATLAGYDALVVTDFGYGLFGAELTEALPRICAAQGKPYYVDVSHSRRTNILKFRGPRLATPTEDELRFAFGDPESGLSNLASRYYRESGAEQLVVTLGKRGALRFEPGEAGARLRTDHLPAFATYSVDPIGAGDVFLAGASAADVARAPMPVGMYLGSALAALHVAHLGNDPVRMIDLQAWLDARPDLAP